MAAKTRNISTLIESQLPAFIIEDYEQFKTFIEKYYEHQELRGNPLDIIHNITSYRNIDYYTNNLLKGKSSLTTSLNANQTTITVEDATSFPEKNGYIKINDEVCFYKERTSTQFLEVSRGVSGTITLGDLYNKSSFVTTEAESHKVDSEVLNISDLFLYAFVRNFENEYLGAFPEKYLKGEVDKATLIKNISDFYRAKGTDRSIRFIFATLISKESDEEVTVAYPKEKTLKASVSDYSFTTRILVSVISGDPTTLIGSEISQENASAIVDNVIRVNDGWELILAPDTIVGTFQTSIQTELRKSVTPSLSGGDRVTVFSTSGYPLKGDLLIGGSVFSYNGKNVNQFFITKRESSNTIFPVNTKVFRYVETKGKDVVFYVNGVIEDVQPSNPKPYAKTGDILQVNNGGFQTNSPVIYNSDKEVRWLINTAYSEPNSVYANVNIPGSIADVSAVYSDDQYFYICSSSFPSAQEFGSVNFTQNLKDQQLLKLIRKEPITTTEVYNTGTRDVGILVDGTPVLSNKSKDQVVRGPIEEVTVTNRGNGYVVPPVVLVNEQPDKVFAVLSGQTVSRFRIDDDSVYDADPTIRITSGEGAVLSPVITNGAVTSIKIDNPGKYYVSPPTIIITDLSGRGGFAQYEAIISNGEIIDFTKISGGKLYNPELTAVIAVPVGSGATATSRAKRWNRNKYAQYNQLLDTNNSYVYESSFEANSFGYGVIANPVVLRRRLQDSITALYEETSVLDHSPILGYAYDGNPIYGPYGYTDPLDSNSIITRMVSGYSINSSRPDGPSTITDALGSFVEDYTWNPSVNSEKTQLDANNGRFCVTPDYPEGTYAYFLTIDANNNPVFPYVLGANFYSLPVDSNYTSPIRQRDLPLSVKRLETGDYVSSGSGFRAYVGDVTRGSVQSARVLGSQSSIFSVGSEILTENRSVSGIVDSLKGKEVVSIESKETKAVRIKTTNTAYVFAGDTLSQASTGAFGEIIKDVLGSNDIVVRNVTGSFDLENPVESDVLVQRLLVNNPSNYTLGATLSLQDTETESIVATGEVLEGVSGQNTIIIKVLSGVWEVNSNYFVKSSALQDTSRSALVSIQNLSSGLVPFEINDKIAILETSEDHGISVDDFVTVDIDPDETTTETTYFVRKKLYQDIEARPLSHNSRIVDTGIGSGDILSTGVSYTVGTYFDVELVFQDATQAREGIGLSGDPGNARATIVVTEINSGFGYVSSVTITNKGFGYRPQDIITFVQGFPIGNIDPTNPQRFAFAVDHVGFAETNDRLFLSTVSNLSIGDFIKIGSEIVEISSVDVPSASVRVIRGSKGTIPINHFDGNSVEGEEIPFRLTLGSQPLDSGPSQPIITEFDPKTNKIKISYDYGDSLNTITRISGGTVFFDESSPRKTVALRNVGEVANKLELSKGDQNNFTVNPTIDLQKYYTYKFDVSHFSMANTFLDISPSINYNILVDGKEISGTPGLAGSFVKVKFGYKLDLGGDLERILLRYDTYYYFIKAFGVDTEQAAINVINDPLTGKKRVTYVSNDKIVYDLDSEPEYDGSGDIRYTTSSLGAVGFINSVAITSSRNDLSNLPGVVGVFPSPDNTPELEIIIRDGSILRINVLDGGNGFVDPKVVLEGNGTGAEIKPLFAAGKLISIAVRSGGSGYTEANISVVESSTRVFLESNNIGTPKNVTIFNYGVGFTKDFTTTPEITSNTVLVLDYETTFVPGDVVIQPDTGARANVVFGQWKSGSSLLKVKDVEGSFEIGKSIKSIRNATTAIVKDVLVTRFVENVGSLSSRGVFTSERGKIGVSEQKLLDSFYYQDYSYEIKSRTTIDQWRDLIKETTHPAGFEVFGVLQAFVKPETDMPISGRSGGVKRIVKATVENISTLSTTTKLNLSIAKFATFNEVVGVGGINVDDVDVSATDFKNFNLVPGFDGVLDQDTLKRIGTTTFSIRGDNGNTFAPFSDEQLLVSLDGIIQEPGVAYTVVGTEIEFAQAPFGPRIAEGQDVPPQKLVGRSLGYFDPALQNAYHYKVRDISDQFDNVKDEFELYKTDGSIVKSEDREDFIVVIDGVKQTPDDNYTIIRDEDPTVTDKILFKKRPFTTDPLYDFEDEREENIVRIGQKCFIFSIGNYSVASPSLQRIKQNPKGPFLMTDKRSGDVLELPDDIYALVFVNNILQDPESSYKIVGSVIRFNQDLPFGELLDGSIVYPKVEILYIYGKSVDSKLTLFNYERDAYFREATISTSGGDAYGDQTLAWFGDTVDASIQNLGCGEVLYTQEREDSFEYNYQSRLELFQNGDDFGFGSFSQIPLFNQPTQTFTVTWDGSNFLIDGAVTPTLQLSPVNTYRFDVSDPSLGGIEIDFQPANGDSINGRYTVIKSASMTMPGVSGAGEGNPNAYIYLIVNETADTFISDGIQIRYYDFGTELSEGFIDVVSGPAGRAVLGASATITVEDEIIGVSLDVDSENIDDYLDGDILENASFIGNGIGDNTWATIFRADRRETYNVSGPYIKIGAITDVRPTTDGRFKITVKTETNWPEDHFDNKQLVIQKRYNMMNTIRFIIPGTYDIVSQTPTDIAGNPLLVRSTGNSSGIISGNRAWFDRRKTLNNLNLNDEIEISGENKYRNIISIDYLARSTQYNPGEYIGQDFYTNLITGPYNGPQEGKNLNIYCTIDDEGRVDKIIWNQIEWTDFGIISQQMGFFDPPKLYFIPKNNIGGGAKAEISFMDKGRVVSVELLDPGYGYDEPPRIVVAKPYRVRKNINNRIDTVSVINVGLTANVSAFFVSFIFTVVPTFGADFQVVVDISIPEDQDISNFIRVVIENDVLDAAVTVDSEDLASALIRSKITTLDVQVLDSVRDIDQTDLKIVINNELPVPLVTDQTDIRLKLNVETEDYFFGPPIPSSHGFTATTDAPFLIGDTILYVTSTNSFAPKGELEIISTNGLEYVSYHVKEDDRFYIDERGILGTTEINHPPGSAVRILPDFSVSIASPDIGITVEEPVIPGSELFAFFANVAMANDLAERRIKVGIFPTESVAIALGNPNIDPFGNERNADFQLNIEPKIQPYQNLDFFFNKIYRRIDLDRGITPVPNLSIETTETDFIRQVLDLGVESVALQSVSASATAERPIITRIETEFNVGLEDINIEFQQGSIIIVPGVSTEYIFEIPVPMPTVQFGAVFKFRFITTLDVEGGIINVSVADTELGVSPRITLKLPEYIADVSMPITQFGENESEIGIKKFLTDALIPIGAIFDIEVARPLTIRPELPTEEVVDEFVVEASVGIDNIRTDANRVIIPQIDVQSVVSVGIIDQGEIIEEIEDLVDETILIGLGAGATIVSDVKAVHRIDNELPVVSPDFIRTDVDRNIIPEIFVDTNIIVDAPQTQFIENELLVTLADPESTDIRFIVQPVLDTLTPSIFEVGLPVEVAVEEVVEDIDRGLTIRTPAVLSPDVTFEYEKVIPVNIEAQIFTQIVEDYPINRVIIPQIGSGTFSVVDVSPAISINFPPTEEGEIQFYAFVNSPVATEFEVFKTVPVWTGGATNDTGGESPIDLAVAFVGENLGAEFKALRIIIPETNVEISISQAISIPYPGEHYFPGTDTLNPDEGFYANFNDFGGSVQSVTFIREVSVPVDPEGPEEETIQTTSVADVSIPDDAVDFFMYRRINNGEGATVIEYGQDFNITKAISIDIPGEHLDNFDEPLEFVAVVDSPVTITNNFDDYLTLPDPILPERKGAIVNYIESNLDLRADIESELITRRIRRDIDVSIEIDIERIKHVRTSKSIDDLAVNVFGATPEISTSIFQQDPSDLSMVEVQTTPRYVQRIDAGIADEISDELGNKYLRTTLGVTYSQFEANAFISNGAILVNASIGNILANVIIGDFEERADSSQDSNGIKFNYGIPTINNLSADLSTDININDTTITVVPTLDGPESQWPTSGKLIISDGTDVEFVEYTGVSGNTFTGVIRGANTTFLAGGATPTKVRTFA